MSPKKNTVEADSFAFFDAHPFVRDAVVDKIFGCIFGSALGDTIGLYTEFMDKAQVARVYKFGISQWPKFQLVKPATKLHPDAHRSRFAPCAWTDDTDQALLILLSYLHNYTNAPDDQSPPDYARDQLQLDFAARLQVWIRQGLLALERPGLGIGALVGKVVSDKKYLSDPVSVATKQWIKGGYKDAPNGSLMRTHPIGVIGVGLSEEETWNLCISVGHTTHVDPRCTVSCCILVGLIRGLLRGEITNTQDVDACIDRTYAFVLASPALMNPGNPKVQTTDIKNRLHRKDFERYVYATDLKDLALDEPDKIGYVYKCLGSAIWALRIAIRSSSRSIAALKLNYLGIDMFERTTTMLVLEGGDADTNAATACAVLGAYVGYSRLPPHWTKGLDHSDFLRRKTKRLIKTLGIVGVIPELDIEGDEAVLANGPWRERERPWEERLADRWIWKVNDAIANGETATVAEEGMEEWLEEKREGESELGNKSKKEWEDMKKRVSELVRLDEEESEENSDEEEVDGEEDSDDDDDEDDDDDDDEEERKKAEVEAKKRLLKTISADLLRKAAAQAQAMVDKAVTEAKGRARDTDSRETQQKKEKTKKRKADVEVEEFEKETKASSRANTKKTRVEPKVVVEKKKKPVKKNEKKPADDKRKNLAPKTGQRVLRSTRIANQKKK